MPRDNFMGGAGASGSSGRSRFNSASPDYFPVGKPGNRTLSTYCLKEYPTVQAPEGEGVRSFALRVLGWMVICFCAGLWFGFCLDIGLSR